MILNLVEQQHQQNTLDTEDKKKMIQTTIPYAGKKGELIAREVHSCLKRHPVKTRISYRARRLGSIFNVKAKILKKT